MSEEELSKLMLDLKRHFDVTAEGMRGDIRTVAEGVLTLERQMNRRFDEIDERFDVIDKRFDDTQALVRLSYSQLENRLETLESRVMKLEAAVFGGRQDA